MRRIFTTLVLLSALFANAEAQIPANDASMYRILIPYYSEFQSITVIGVFKNSGTDTLRSVIINWAFNDGPVKQLTKADLAVSRNQTWPFTLPEDLVLNTEGNFLVRVWTSSPNGTTDGNHLNDTLKQTIQVIEKYPERHILIEEVTGAWCGYCPRAPIIYKTNVWPAYPNTILAAIHSGDGMTASESRDFMNTYVTGVPTGFVDRKRTQLDPGIDFAPEDWQNLLSKIDLKFTPAELSVYNYYDPSTRNWKIDVVADFVFDMTGSYRMNCYIMEDSLSGTGSSWEQRNFFNGGASAPYQSLQGAGDPIPGYQHMHVVRRMLGGSWGQAGIIPSNIKKGDRYVFSQTIKADQKWNMNHVRLVGIIQQWDTDKFKRPIINALEGKVALITGAAEIPVETSFRVFPNPVNDLAKIEFNTNNYSAALIQVLDMRGNEVYSANIAASNSKKSLMISMKSFAPGVYFFKLTGSSNVAVIKVIKE